MHYGLKAGLRYLFVILLRLWIGTTASIFVVYGFLELLLQRLTYILRMRYRLRLLKQNILATILNYIFFTWSLTYRYIFTTSLLLWKYSDNWNNTLTLLALLLRLRNTFRSGWTLWLNMILCSYLTIVVY